MKNYDAPSINIPSRGQRFVLARRNCPEVILPSGATQTAITPGSAWALGTRVNEVTATQFGNNPLILIGVEVLLSSTISLTTNSTVFIVEHGQIRLYKDNNLGTGDELIAEFPWYANASVNMSGNTVPMRQRRTLHPLQIELGSIHISTRHLIIIFLRFRFQNIMPTLDTMLRETLSKPDVFLHWVQWLQRRTHG